MFILKKWFVSIFGEDNLQQNYIIVGSAGGGILFYLIILICFCIKKCSYK